MTLQYILYFYIFTGFSIDYAYGTSVVCTRIVIWSPPSSGSSIACLKNRGGIIWHVQQTFFRLFFFLVKKRVGNYYLYPFERKKKSFFSNTQTLNNVRESGNNFYSFFSAFAFGLLLKLQLQQWFWFPLYD